MKKTAFLMIGLLAALVCLAVSCTEPRTGIGNMRCEYMKNPLGIDSRPLRFTWQLENMPADTISQVSYVLEVSDDKAFVPVKTHVLRAESPALPALFDIELKPFTKYYWRVTVTCNDATRYVSPISWFETGVMDTGNWQGSWISDGKPVENLPAPYFRKEFTLEGEIASVRAYITSAGYNELSINGKKVGDRYLDPAYTKFDKRTLYSTYDVTNLVSEGNNGIGVILGNGWYNHQSTAVWDFHVAYWRARPAFLMNLRVTYKDGHVETISTGSDWKTTDAGPVIFNSIYTAEHYDARLEMPGWNKKGYDDSTWNQAVTVTSPTEKIVSQQMEPVRVTDVLKPVSVDMKSDTCYVYDFGRNIAGVVKLKVEGESGTVLRLIHSERLYEDGHVDMSNIDCHYRPTDDSDPFQTDIVILKDGTTEFMPRFNYKGFQYVEVHSSAPVKMDKASLTAYELHSDVKLTGQIESSNKLLPKLWTASNSSYLANLFGYPTDCPQREKNGWTGDAHLNIETALYSFDAITVYEKWLEDHMDEQKESGVLPAIVPTAGWGYDWGNGPDWTSTITVIPWEVYRFYGEPTLLKKIYPYAKKYMEYTAAEKTTGYLTEWGLGDWIPVDARSSVKLTSSAFYYRNAVIMSKAAAMFGYEDDAAHYTRLAANIKEAFNREFLDREAGIYASGTQTELSAPLYMGLVPDDIRERVAQNLYDKVASNDFKLDVGLLGSKTLLNALSENGYGEAAYRIASKEEFPSWGWWIVNGATTFYENWNIDAQYDISLNHIMYGEVNAWLFKGLGGIYPDENKPGFLNIILRPYFAEGVESFTAKHTSLYGEIVSSWKKEGSKVVYTVKVPTGCTAQFFPPVNAPGDFDALMGAGEHKFTLTLQ